MCRDARRVKRGHKPDATVRAAATREHEFADLRAARDVLVGARMPEFTSLDRCAAYVAARHALTAIHRTVTRWPPPLADQAKRAAIEVVMTTAEGIGHDHASPARRRCLRAAIGSAIEVAAVVDVARAMGFADVERAQQLAGRSVAMLGLFLHASAIRFEG